MKRLISILLTVVMLASMLVAVIPASAATVAVESTDKSLKFLSGLDNLWYTDKKMTAMPKTIEATIDVPSSMYDIYEGQVVAWYSVNSSTGHYLWVDLVRKNASNQDASANLGLRVLVKNGSTEMTKVYYDSLNAYVGQKIHFAITFDSAVNLYINGELYTGGSFITGGDKTETQLVSVYNSIDVSKIPALSFGGDDRNGNPTSQWPKTRFDNFRYFKGGIYNMCIFSDVRNANEIAADKTSVDTATADNLILAYDSTNVPSDSKAISDATGNGYDLKRTFHGKKFTSGFDNVYSSKTQVTALPKTLEATIFVPTSADDQYWGDIMAWNDDGNNYVVWDLRSQDGNGGGAMSRFLVKANGTGVTLNFTNSVNAYKGQTVHLAITIDTTVKLYVNGIEHTTVSGDAASAANIYNSLDVANLRMPSIGGDFRAKIADSQWAVHHVDNYRWFRGRIFNLAAFTDVRSTTELAADVNTLPVQGADNLLMSYDLWDETDARVIPDKSGNGYHMAAPLKWTDAEDKEQLTGYGYSFAVIGDTQVITRDESVTTAGTYNAAYKGHLAKLYDWILNNQEEKNIQFAFHMGDVTDWSQKSEWDLTMENWAKMSGVLPYNVARGNHDGGPAMVSRYTTEMFKNNVVVGEEFGFFDGRGIDNYQVNTLNTYQTITVGDVMYLMMSLDLGPCKAVIEWANEVIAAHPYHNVIISTHSYLQGDYTGTWTGMEHYPYMDGDKDCAANQYNPGGKYNGGSYKDNNGNSVYWDYRLQQHKDGGENYLYQDATYMLNNLVKKHSNISMVLCGHECSEYVKQISATGEAGNNVLQFLVDGQGVDADLRSETNHAGLVAMFYFSEDGKKVTTEYYSTIREQYLHDMMNTNTYDVNTVTVPASVKAFYELMHSLDPNDYSAGAWAAITEKLAEVKNTVVTTSDMTVVDNAVASLQVVIDATEDLDYTQINDAINAAEALAATDYTVADWNAIEEAIATAKAVLPSLVQADLDNAATALNSAIAAKTKLDREALNAAITAAEALNPFDYSSADWNDILAAIDTAKQGRTVRTQDEIDAFIAPLNSAIAAKTKLNLATLNAAIAEAEALEFEDYTSSSWSALVVALMDARAKAASRDQTQIDAATAALNSAMEGLVERPTTTPPAGDGNEGGEGEGEGNTPNEPSNGESNDATNDASDSDTDSDTASDTTENEEGGCGAAIAASTVVLATVLALGLGLKKKED